jgi:hypothetical protein
MVQGSYDYTVTYVTADGETLPANDSTWGNSGTGGRGDTVLGSPFNHSAMSLNNIPRSPDARVTARKIYRTRVNSQLPYGLVATINDNTTTTYKDTLADSGLGAEPPTVAGTHTGRVQVSSISVGPSGTTSRKLYRTVAGGSVYKLLATISDNSTTTYADNTADGSLGANLSTGSYGASAGDTSMRVVDLAQLPDAGWLRVGQQIIRYTGREATSGPGSVTGIPSTGFGAITVNIPTGTTVVVEPHLEGVSGVLYRIPSGEEISVLTVHDDEDAQAALAAWLGYGDGIVEGFIADGRLSLSETTARGAAKLLEVKDPIVSVEFDTRNPNFQIGQSVTMTLTSPPISGTFQIQHVTLTQLQQAGRARFLYPVRHVRASSQRRSFESWLRHTSRQLKELELTK